VGVTDALHALQVEVRIREIVLSVERLLFQWLSIFYKDKLFVSKNKKIRVKNIPVFERFYFYSVEIFLHEYV